MRKLTRADKKLLIFNQKKEMRRVYYPKFTLLKVHFWLLKMNRLAKKYNLDLYACENGHYAINFKKADGTESSYEYLSRRIEWLWEDPKKGVASFCKELERYSQPTRQVAFGILIPYVLGNKKKNIKDCTYGDWAILRRQ